jgi:hypothetical protein
MFQAGLGRLATRNADDSLSGLEKGKGWREEMVEEKNIEIAEGAPEAAFSDEEWQELLDMDFGPSRAMWGTFAPMALMAGLLLGAVAYMIAK